MHEIPPEAEQLLRAQGFTSGEIDELRRNGHVQRADAAGSSIQVQLASANIDASSDGVVITGGQIPPEAIARLRQFHRFIPDETLAQLEEATGQDIDGDGQIGRGGRAHETTPHAHALPSTAGTDGPFVGGQSSSSRLLPTLVASVALVALGIWLVTRLA